MLTIALSSKCLNEKFNSFQLKFLLYLKIISG